MAQGSYMKKMSHGALEFEHLVTWAGRDQVFEALPDELQQRYVRLMEESIPYLTEFQRSLDEFLQENGTDDE